MKVIHIIPGSGGSFYCGNCMRDSKYIHALRKQGVDVVVVPMYLPLVPFDGNQEVVPVFYGAISLYLKQVFPIFRHAPAWVDALLNSKPMLKFAAKMANSTRSSGLEAMTLSMLHGENGKQKEELAHLADWLKNHFKADLIHISNALLLGLAHKLREQLNVPVLCTLQDEDVWVDAMGEDFRATTWGLMAEKAKDIDQFVSVSAYFTAFMKEKINLTDAQITTLHLGVDPTDYVFQSTAEKGRNIGYLSRLCYDNGLDILVDAFILLKKMPNHADCKLYLTGGHTADDTKFIAIQTKKLKKAGLLEEVIILPDFETEDRAAFFKQISLLSVPVRNGEAFGIYLTEAMAAGIPIVQPALGAFPEIVAISGGGVLYEENNAAELANALSALLQDDVKRNTLSVNARKSIENDFNIHALAEKLVVLYQNTINTRKKEL